MIVKVQTPIRTTAPNPKCLVYDRERTVETMIPVVEMSKLMAGRLKAFFEANVTLRDGEAHVEFIAEVHDPGW